ncbi:thioredoxin domain-containing protein [uncultured Leifsonia sp.]|uniref:DsbA family protein n=1 Tax=Leifsonia sp. TaxID=1870902 RepID=UPI0028D6D0D2|nr:thioredoxin domain-containing protein [uncultured Leifsonia sp.]
MTDPDDNRSGDVRAAAREKARQLRTSQQRKDRRRKALLSGGIVIGVLAIAAIVAVVIVSAIRPTVPGPKNMASDGVVIGAGLKVKATPALAADAKPVTSTPDPSASSAVDIRIYADYLCKLCGQFQRTNLDQLEPLVKDGAVTVAMHPVAIYTSHSAGTRYSLRAANAAACVANYSPDAFWAFNQSLFEKQPAEGGPGLTDQQLKDRVAGAKATNLSDIDSCIDDGRFKTWVGAASDRALNGPIPNSDVRQMRNALLVLVNGKPYTGSLTSADDFKAFVLQAQGEEYSSTGTPTPTPTPTAG